MKISATSALVLNWTDPALWQTPEASAYFNQLDLSEGDSLLALFSMEESYMHRQAVSGRKYFMKQKIIGFLSELQKQGRKGQVIILAAGLAPLSIEIASLFPSCPVYDVDRFLMSAKKELVNGHPAKIKFIECDITDVITLNEKLLQSGFNPDEPAIAIMEGIIYYIRRNDFKNILQYFNKNKMSLACDFCLQPGLVNQKTRHILTEVFRKIKEGIHLDFIQFYSEDGIMQLISEAGYRNISVTNMQQIQEERTGNPFPFVSKDYSWVNAIYAE